MSFLRKIIVMTIIIFGSFGCGDECPPVETVVRCSEDQRVETDECGSSYCVDKEDDK